MEIKRTRVNYRLLGKLRSIKHNGIVDKTMYAKKLGLIKNNANVIVIDVKDTEQEANAKIQKTIDDFKYDRTNESDLEIISNTFNIVKDDVKNQFLVVCDRQEYLLRTSTKTIREQNFTESSQFIDDHYVPLRINWEHLSKVEEEKNRRIRGEEYILNQKQIATKEKMTFKKIMSGIFDSVFSASLDGI